MQRTILVTVVKNQQTGIQSKLYGRQDLVSLFNKGLVIIDTYKEVYEMSDSDFAKYGKIKEKR